MKIKILIASLLVSMTQLVTGCNPPPVIGCDLTGGSSSNQTGCPVEL